MEEKAKEMLTKLGNEYTIEDLISLACIILIQVSPMLPIKVPLKHILGIIVDGRIIADQYGKDVKANLANGILSIQGESKPN